MPLGRQHGVEMRRKAVDDSLNSLPRWGARSRAEYILAADSYIKMKRNLSRRECRDVHRRLTMVMHPVGMKLMMMMGAEPHRCRTQPKKVHGSGEPAESQR